MEKVIEEQKGKVKLVTVNIDRFFELSHHLKIKVIPKVFLVHNGVFLESKNLHLFIRIF